jgi:hypothetical protein
MSSKSIKISQSKYDSIQEIAKKQNTKVGNLIDEAIDHVIDKYSDKKCYICDILITETQIESCSDHIVCCGYAKFQRRSSWEGESWIDDPVVECFICILNELESEFFMTVNFEERDLESEEDRNQILDTYQDIIDDYINTELFEEENYSDMTTQSDLIQKEIIEPKSWSTIEKELKSLLAEYIE